MEHTHTGLTQKEASIRIKTDGYNELPSQKSKSAFALIWSVITEPMILLLVLAGTIYFLLGEPKDAVMLAFSVIVVIAITFFQEKKTERTLEALRNLASPRALVIRGGVHMRIPGREVVRDDIILLREGDRVPADSYIVENEHLVIDESLLTGESQPVKKSVWDTKNSVYKPGGDNIPYVFSGSLVVSGRGIAKVAQVGNQTEMGKIGKALETIKQEDTLLKKETDKIVRNFTIFGSIPCIIVILLYAFRYGNILQGFLSGLTLSMAILPEEFPVVLLIFMTLGAWRISKRHVLARRSAVIETLGAATVLCVDKTGTITENRMSLEVIHAGPDISRLDEHPLPTNIQRVLELSVLSSQRDPFDPIEKELVKVANEKLPQKDLRYLHWNLVREYPLTREIVARTHIWKLPENKTYLVVTKGAPETILDLCHVTDEFRNETLHKIEEMSHDGLRILAVASAPYESDGFPTSPHDFPFIFEGLLGFRDPVRSTVPASIQTAYEAGIRTIMITGDYPGTASYIAEAAGLKNPTRYITGDELDHMSHAELREKIREVNVFARVVPEQKLHIIEALKANGEVVAMTGDGVNDAPALKSAHIGIAMGGRGTDVAREASSLVLLDDDFSSIVAAVRLGRRIFDNLKRSMRYILAVHIPTVGLSCLPVLFGLPVVLLPAHIAFLELIIDPACSTVFETIEEESEIMKKPPRRLTDPLFNKRIFAVGLTQGISVCIIIFAIYLYLLSIGKSDIDTRSITFLCLVISSISLIIVNLGWSKNTLKILVTPNKTLWWVIGLGGSALVAIFRLEPLRQVFHLGILHLDDVLYVVVVAIVLYIWLELMKKIWAVILSLRHKRQLRIFR
jgi:P-type Ca2+ transporter type 2C